MPSNETPSKNPTDGTPPLVRIERIDGVVFAIFTDPTRTGFEYDPSIRSVQQALEIARHVAEKRWITEAHLQQYETLMMAEFGEGAARG
ncbi:hypothetical protein FHY35_004020 [Xanthomonas arboricola]|uniref:hypothetical protein n=1 Tax=Xanthomonas arboricola TaxID=56448 RepID=UPI00141B54E2|nr:hypothetical protein [Xanthomonas arboricola]NIJ86970.1 hypothetical protein [Xanthomonas arboricola]